MAANDDAIASARRNWVSGRQADHLEFVIAFSFHTSSKLMDYLHGDVKEEEKWWACQYEYSRESKAMRQAAKARDALQQANPQVSCERIVLTVAGQHPENWWAGMFRSLKFLMCGSFPGKDWNELSEAERNAIMDGPPGKTTRPLPMPDVWTLTWMLKAPPWSDKLRLLME